MPGVRVHITDILRCHFGRLYSGRTVLWGLVSVSGFLINRIIKAIAQMRQTRADFFGIPGALVHFAGMLRFRFSYFILRMTALWGIVDVSGFLIYGIVKAITQMRQIRADFLDLSRLRLHITIIRSCCFGHLDLSTTVLWGIIGVSGLIVYGIIKAKARVRQTRVDFLDWFQLRLHITSIHSCCFGRLQSRITVLWGLEAFSGLIVYGIIKAKAREQQTRANFLALSRLRLHVTSIRSFCFGRLQSRITVLWGLEAFSGLIVYGIVKAKAREQQTGANFLALFRLQLHVISIRSCCFGRLQSRMTVLWGLEAVSGLIVYGIIKAKAREQQTRADFFVLSRLYITMAL